MTYSDIEAKIFGAFQCFFLIRRAVVLFLFTHSLSPRGGLESLFYVDYMPGNYDFSGYLGYAGHRVTARARAFDIQIVRPHPAKH